ncbi:unnamed protein product [Effrenium voratum]|nr:unnamed protein product [Effrenium voratum]
MVAKLDMNHTGCGCLQADIEPEIWRWRAPEVVSSTYTRSSDVYSFGVFMFEVLSRKIPYDELEPQVAQQCIAQGKRPNVELVQEHCPPQLLQLLHCCWEQPDARPTAAALHARLSEALEALAKT